MKSDRFRSIGPALVLIPIGGLVVLALSFLLYGLVYNVLESIFFPNDPLSFPAGLVRTLFAVVLVLLYLIIYRMKMPDLLKAILLIGPVATLIVASILFFYDRPAVFIPLMLAIPIVCAVLLYYARKPWTYLYALAIAALGAILYGWPRY
jgi:hypothetical protein